ADKHGIHLLTNYETTWYATNHKAYEILNKDKSLGDLRKVVAHAGHDGRWVPKGHWIADPVQSGGGAIMDFGCYGANLITWLANGKRPQSVFAVTQTIKPENYPNVDDEATIILQYPKMQGIIQASWNWPFSRKDIEVYGKTGYVFSDNRWEMRIRKAGEDKAGKKVLAERKPPYGDAFSFFAAVVKEEIEMLPYDLSSLENNMITMEILDAAIRSAKSGKVIYLNRK
ncbi:MAG: Gfo/Idh/MocA family oxidoreductase, partial [Pyrinomonadaceae bacterium]|nr:Gfo/Idh/MocA family oxidoreductase [Pyrinomonadaceae bacterium]